MAKKYTPKDDDEKIVKENIQKRFKNMFSGKGQPLSNMSLQEVEALQSRVAELETKLAKQSGMAEKEASAPVQEVSSQPLPARSAEESQAPAAKRLAEIKRPSQPTENSTPNARNAVLIAILIAVVHIVAAVYYLYLGRVSGTSQFSILAIVSFALGIVFGIGAMLSKRGQPIGGMLLVLGTLAVSYPPIATLIGGLGLVLGLALMIVGPMTAFNTLPRKPRWVMTIATIASALATILLDVFGSGARPFLPGIFIWLLAAAVVVALGFSIVRQAISGSIRTKLTTAFVIVAVFSMAILAFSAQRSLSTSLTENIGTNLAKLANTKAIEIGQTVDRESDLLKALALNQDIQKAAASANSTNLLSQAEIARLDEQWKSADAANTNNDPLIAHVLYNSISSELQRFQKAFPEHVEVFVTDRQGVSIASTNRTSDYYQADEEWWQIASQKGLYIGQPEYDESSKTFAINMAVAVDDRQSGQILGILRTTVNFSTLSESLIAGQFGQTGHTDIYLPNGQDLTLKTMEDGSLEMAMTDAELDINVLAQSAEPYMEVSHNGIPALASQAIATILSDSEADVQAINNLNWHVVVMQNQAEALQPVNVQTRNNIFLVVVIIIAVIIAVLILARVITDPIMRLKAVTEKIASGDLTAEARVDTKDEIGTLAATFNKMTSQLRDLFGSLEQRVQDRTHDLELASEVGRTATEKVTNLSEMLTEAAEMIRSRFSLYYTQIYLLDPSGERITLRAGTGEVGKELLARGHYLLVNANSLNGRAVIEKQAQIVPDTSENPNFLPNPLLPNTRSEMSVPLTVGGNVVGVLDMQSEQPGALSEINLPAFEALAGQLAIAIQNTALFTELQEARAEAESQIRRFTEEGWQDFLDGIHEGQKIGFAFDESNVIRLKPESLLKGSDGDNFHLPITMTGTKIGEIHLPSDPKHTLTTDEMELIQTIGAQLAQHVENLRLLAQAERYRTEAEQAVRRLTHEGWDNFLQTYSKLGQGYMFDLTEVKPLSEKNHDATDYTIKHPMAVGDEIIGELAVNIPGQAEEAAQVLMAVAEQLSAHIENLRLSELNEKNAQREQTLRQITSALRSSNNPTTIMRTAVRELGSIMGRRTVVQLVSPQQANQTQSAVNDKNESDTPAHQS